MISDEAVKASLFQQLLNIDDGIIYSNDEESPKITEVCEKDSFSLIFTHICFTLNNSIISGVI